MSSLNDVADEFQPIFDRRAQEIEQERIERQHRLELAQVRKEQKAVDVAHALDPLFSALDKHGDDMLAGPTTDDDLADIFATDPKENDR